MGLYVSTVELTWKPGHYVSVTAETAPAAEKGAETIALMSTTPHNNVLLPLHVVSITYI